MTSARGTARIAFLADPRNIPSPRLNIPVRLGVGGKLGWFPFYPRDWYGDPKLACCHPSSRGIWIDLLSLMFIDGRDSITFDHRDLMRIGRCDLVTCNQFVTDLRRYKFADVTECNGAYTVTSRRLARDSKDLDIAREKNRLKVQRHRQKKHVTKSNQSTGVHSSVYVSNSNSSSEDIKKSKILVGERTWPEDLSLTDPMKKYALDRSINPATEFAAWRDDCLAHGRKYRDWEAAWRTRINNAPKFASKNGQAAVVELPQRKENYVDKVNRW